MGSFIFRMARRKRVARWGRLPAAGLGGMPAAFTVSVFSSKVYAGSIFAVPGAKIKKDFGSYENCAIFAPSFAGSELDRRPKRRSFEENGAIAQLVEQRTENPCVTGSIPVRATWRWGEQVKILLSFFRIRLSCPGLSGIGILRVRNPGIRFYGGCCSRIPGRFFPARLKDLGIVPSRRACIDCRGNFCLRLADVSDFFFTGFP